MEIFRDTNFDFLKWKWPFIGASLLLTVVGLASWAMKGGLSYGIDFKGGVEMRVRFQNAPPVDQIRKALEQKIKGEKHSWKELRLVEGLTGPRELEKVK